MTKKKPTNLVIVESPAKARAISRYLGNDFAVEASVGHVRDLPKKELGVDPEKGFEPTYAIIHGKKKVLNQIKKAARGADVIYVATDPDREGEAIAWHIVDELEIPAEAVRRAAFYEVTPAAVRRAIQEPGHIDARKVDAQQARRILDRLVGYKISPLLNEPFYPGLSAGRVQTVALRLVVEREEEIEAFQRVPYWRVKATLEAPDTSGEVMPFEAELRRVAEVPVVPRGQPRDDDFRPPALATEEAAIEVVERARAESWSVSDIERTERRRNAPPPFTTSTLQQSAARRLRLSPRQTMALAQRLYEGIEIDGQPVGLITYMRTDATRVSEAALEEVRGLIDEKYGAEYCPDKPIRYKSGAQAQEAHEAIRPTSVLRSPTSVKPALRKMKDGDRLARLYEWIWLRFVTSQMKPAVFDRTSADFLIAGDLEFRASGSVLKFPGFLRAYLEAGHTGQIADDVLLPPLEAGQGVTVVEVESEGKETKPPARYSEAGLVKELEAQGIGRPSTYASIISRLFHRKYADREDRRIRPTVLGRFVLKYLLHHFDDIFEVGFTSGLEEELDKIEEGELPWRKVVGDLWGPLSQDIDALEENGEFHTERDAWFELEAPTCSKDPEHGPMTMRWNRFGPFWGCSRYPDCKQTTPIPELGPEPPSDPCPNDAGELVIKRGRRGPFVGCANYPDCDFTMNIGEDPAAAQARRQAVREADAELDRNCPECGDGRLGVKSGRFGTFIGCSNYPKCRHTESLPTGIKCPECGEGDLTERRGKGKGRRFYGCSRYPDCDYTQQGAPRVAQCEECDFPVAEVRRSEGEETLRCPRCGAEVVEPTGSKS